MSFQSVLKGGTFAVTTEIGPSKGTNVDELMTVAELLRGKVDAVNVTDQQSSVMRLGSLTFSHLLSEAGLEPVFQLTCRDRNRIALQSDLLSASVLGVRNVLAITGDLPQLGDHPQAKPVYDLDSVQLLAAIGKLNSGFDMNGNALKGKTDFFPGAVVNPGANTEVSLKLQLLKMEKKIAAGARFFQTQAVFDPEKFCGFMKKTEGLGAPILAGIIPLKNARMARFMNENVAGVNVPETLIKKMTEAKDKTQTGIEIAADLIRQLKDICQGVHIMPIGWEAKVPEILALAGLADTQQRYEKRIKVLIVDDHAVVRDGIRAILALQKDIQVVGEAADGKAAVELAVKFVPDVVLMDIVMPVMDGLEATREIRRSCEAAKVLMLTQFDDRENIRASRDAGAIGFVPKAAASSRLLTGIRAVAVGGDFVSSPVP